MPTFDYHGKQFNNPVELALDQIGGKWKMPILWRLKDKIWRYGELRKSFEQNNAKITHQMLTKQLRELEADGYIVVEPGCTGQAGEHEADGYIARKVYPEVPPKVEYRITEKGKLAVPIINTLRDFGLQLMADAGIKD